MVYFTERKENNRIVGLTTRFTGIDVLKDPRLNKGTAFTKEERNHLRLEGLLPERIETLDEQTERAYAQYKQKNTPLQKNIFLNVLHDTNKTLFFRLISDHLVEMMPIIYTPTMGEAVETFSSQFRRPKGLFISYKDKDRMEEILDNYFCNDIKVIVVTDGEGVLGIGDQGVGGIDISIGKLAIYTLCAQLDPFKTLPIQLDVGTNNTKLLNDPLYLGWKHKRISGREYDSFIKLFVNAVKKKFPGVFLHWEDFGRDNARKNLDLYHDEICSFNDDIQGTGAVALAAVLSGINDSGIPLKEQQIVVFGAGTAGVGITDNIFDAMCREGISPEEAVGKFYLIDREGLLIDDMKDLMSFQKKYARPRQEVSSWNVNNDNCITLEEVVRNISPTILIGCSTVTGAFTSDIIKEMARQTERPFILPLSNPTSKVEANPADIMKWTNGKALIATGSPFGSIDYDSKSIRIAQCNNALIFPGLGLGIVAAKAKTVTDNMIWIASKTLSEYPIKESEYTPLLPDFESVLDISNKIAVNVAEQAIRDGVAGIDKNDNIDQLIKLSSWQPRYVPIIYSP
jgi:malate dehydrogenase (oxaloacetate-decarboxylating)